MAIWKSGTALIGRDYTLQCRANKIDGLANQTTVEWSHDMSSDVIQMSPNTDSPNLTFRDLYFSELRTSHAGRYSCMAGLVSQALDEPLVMTKDYGVTLTSEQ